MKMQRGFIEWIILAPGIAAFLLVATLALSVNAEAQECQPARFVEMESPYVGKFWAVEGPNETFIHIGGWQSHTTRFLAVDKILSIRSWRITDAGNGVLVKLAGNADVYVVEGSRRQWGYGRSVVMWLDGASVADVLARIRCIPSPTPMVQASMTADQRDHAEARRFQVLRALEAMAPEDLL